ncbi:MAG TPA: NAD-dependent succinate-semialdehyde dehydrogenase [Longimicrobiales bacterium]|nr:NAD-dependent succinate-semialdehyde dehydrogenase [Longimicrobiales bacterium]
MKSINPATGEVMREFAEHTDAELEYKLARAHDAYRTYRRTTFKQRSEWLLRAADILEQEKHAFGRLMTLEMGKTIGAAVAEAEKSAWGCRYYAENAESFLADQHVRTTAADSFVVYQPIGAILAIMPWNFPFWQVFRFAAPALMAGNVGLLKHASNVPQCALAIEDVFRRAGFPEGAFQALLIGPDRVARVLADPRIAAATLTGSEAAGAAVAAESGKQLKKTVLELGGSDPFIVMPSADLDRAIETAVKARAINNGQSCIAAKRFIVAEDIADEFERRFLAGMERLVVGDPLDAQTDVGPLALAKIRADLHHQVITTAERGARVLTGGKLPDGKGWFYPPTVLTDIPEDSPAYREELFGPVAALFRVPDIDAAIALANDSTFGLGSCAWTNDAKEQHRFIRALEAGLVFINEMVASDPRLPFGGVKRSGYGRELGTVGIHEFVNIKTVWIGGGKPGQAEAE